MKLRNKKTGEIVDTLCEYDCTKGLCFGVDHHDGNPTMTCYNSLAELNEEWEDYEDDDLSKIIRWIDKGLEDEVLPVLVNDFVEKLKAWKRLKDAGVSFKPTTIGHKWYLEPHASPENRTFKESQDLYKDVMLFFGGEDGEE